MPIQICKGNMSVCHGVLSMQVMQLDPTLNKWERNMKLQKILDLFGKRIMATKIQIKLTTKECINTLAQGQLLSIHQWKALGSLNINIPEVLVKTRLRIKLMISLLSLLERKKWKEQFNSIMARITVAHGDTQLLI